MNIVRKFIVIISLTLFSFIFIPTYKVKANTSEYARVLTDNAVIYEDQNLSEPLFTIPYSYYVKIEENLNGITKVSYGDSSNNYPKIVGFINSEELTIVDYIPTNPYYVIKVSTDTADVLFNDVKQTSPYFNVPKNEVMYYYGEIEYLDNLLCLVYYSKKLGFIDKTCLNPFTITLNPDSIPTIDNDSEIDTQEKPTTSQNFLVNENLRLIIIIGISIISISVVYFLFKPQKNKISEEQNEFSNE